MITQVAATLNLCMFVVGRYGNFLHVLPEPVLALPSLKELWVENNPIADSGRLRPSVADHHLALGPKLRNVGLDQFQVGVFFLFSKRCRPHGLRCVCEEIRKSPIYLIPYHEQKWPIFCTSG